MLEFNGWVLPLSEFAAGTSMESIAAKGIQVPGRAG